jgi:hypothetical protein
MSGHILALCPFCGARPCLTIRPDDAEATAYFAAVACFCGGYSACAHKMATAPTADEAEAMACAAWNRRPAEPLTEQQIAGIFKAWRSGSLFMHMAREVERHHGIGAA